MVLTCSHAPHALPAAGGRGPPQRAHDRRRPAKRRPGLPPGSRLPGFAADQPREHPGGGGAKSSHTGSGNGLPRSPGSNDGTAAVCFSMANGKLGRRSSAEVSSVLSSASRASSCAFMPLAAAAPASCASCSWRFRSAASARAARRSALWSRASCLTVCCSCAPEPGQPAGGARAHVAAPTTATSSRHYRLRFHNSKGGPRWQDPISIASGAACLRAMSFHGATARKPFPKNTR